MISLLLTLLKKINFEYKFIYLQAVLQENFLENIQPFVNINIEKKCFM